MNDHAHAAIVRSGYEAIEKGDAAGLAEVLDDDIIWHESTPGIEGDYHGRAEVMALFSKVFQDLGVQMNSISIHDILANDDHTVILHTTTATRNGHTIAGQYGDVYHLRNEKATEHWHLAFDPKAEQDFWKD
jgi:ketosteroid isomerase-like protein